MIEEHGNSNEGWQLVESAKDCVRRNDFSGAIRFLSEAVRQFKSRADAHGECNALDLLAGLHQDSGNFEQAACFHARGLEVARTLNKAYALVIEHLDGLGISHSNMGKWQQAIGFLEQALGETRKPIVGLRERRARVLQHLANVYTRYTNRYAEAVQLYDEAIAISKSCDDTYNMAACLAFKGQALDAMSNSEMALELYEQARELAEAEKHDQLLATCNAHLAASYSHLGQFLLSKKFCEQALELDQRYSNKQGLSRDFFLLGNLHALEGDEDAALGAYQQSFLQARSIRDVKNTMTSLDRLARIYQNRLQAHRARSYYEEALALCREIGDKRFEIHLIASMATLGDEADLLETLERALADAKNFGFLDLELDIEEGIARLYDHRGDYEAAMTHYERAMALIEQMRASFKVEEHLRAFSETNVEVYDRLVDLSLLLGHKTEAFKHSELARARVLNNLLGTRKARPVSRLQGPQLDQYRKACDEIISLDLKVQRLQLNGLTVPEELEERLRRALVEEAEIVLSIKRAAPETYALEAFDIVGLSELQARLSGFEQNILLLAYYTTDKNSYVFVIGKDSFDVALLGLNSTALRELVQAFRGSLGLREIPTRDLGLVPEEQLSDKIGSASESYLPPGQSLYDLLIRPIESKLHAADHICVIPHGSLHFIPFHALHDGAQFLIEQTPVSYAPSATTLNENLSRQFIPVGKVLALGDPQSELQPLRFARQEVETIEGLLGTERCLQMSGMGATRELIIKAGVATDADSFDCWHLAMHAVFVKAAPHLSYLQLASGGEEDGRVFAFEIAGMEKVGRLCVLSACQTAMTREARGDELSGLLFSFMAAGAQAVIASLWSVADESTSAMMQAFYAQLSGSDRLSLANALQKSILALLASPETASPYYWAPFVLHGNWNPFFPEPAEILQAKLEGKPAQLLSEAMTRAGILLHEGESHLARASMAAEKKSWSLLPDEERAELGEAIESFSQAIEIAPDWSAAYRLRGNAYRNLLEDEKAVADLKRASELSPQDALSLASLGLILAENGQDKQLALESLERAFSIDPKVQLSYRRANTRRFERALEMLRAEKTVEDVSTQIANSPGEGNLYVKRGYAYWQLSYTSDNHEENKKKAAEDLRRALDLNSQCALGAVRLAWIEYSNHKPGAIEAYARIVDMDNSCAEAHLRLADACKFSHQAARAATEYRTALTYDPSIRHAYCGLGETNLEQAKWDAALEAFETERRINPNCFSAHLYLKEIYGAVGRYDEAKIEYLECLRTTEHSLYEGKLGVDLSDEVTSWIRRLAQHRDSKSSQTSTLAGRMQRSELQRYLNRGIELARAGETQQAIEVYSELIERDPRYALAHAYRGGCYGAVREHEKAFEDFHKAIELDPECSVAYFNLYALCHNRGELDKAQHYLDRAIVLDPELAKKIRQEKEKGDGQKGSSHDSTYDLRREIQESYRTSGMKCRWCDRPLRVPLGRFIVTSDFAEMDELLEGVPYFCASCRTTSCFECSADSKLGKVLCRRCSGEMKPWGQAYENRLG